MGIMKKKMETTIRGYIWGSYYSIPESIFYLHKGDARSIPQALIWCCSDAWPGQEVDHPYGNLLGFRVEDFRV